MVRNLIEATFIFTWLLGLIILSACAPLRGPSPSVSEPAKDVPATASTSEQPSWEKEWQQVLAAARKEGKVVYYSSLGGQGREMVRRDFEEKFGIEVEWTTSRGPEMAEKITSERKAGLYYVDVSTSGTTTATLSMKPRGQLAPIPPALILPEVKDPKAWWKGDLDWGDNEKSILSFSASPSSPVAINTDIVRRDEIKSYRDLLNLKWKGKISLNDPTIGGAGSKIVGAIGEKIMGMDFLTEFAKMEPFIIRDRYLQIQWLAQGKYPIAMMPSSPTIMEFRQLGAPVIGFSPVEGTYLSSGFGTVVLIDKAPHPNAAKVFLNWLLTREAQTLFSKATDAQSGRVDVPTDHLDRDRVRQPGIKYIDAYSEEFILKESEHMKIAGKIFGHLMK